ncbi:MAG: DUF1214 domain-containing protein [Spirochaetia bacterium]|jgi:hypothetical protein
MSTQQSSPAHGRIGRAFRLAVDVLLGILAGIVLTLIATNLLLFVEAKSVYGTVNSWSYTMKAGKPGHSLLLRALMADQLPATNVAEESVYWLTAKDSTGQKLNGQHDYLMHFPAGGLPPAEAFWSLTMTDAKKALVANPTNRYSVGDRSGLVPNADGSTDIYIQNTAPAGHESNWLPAPTGAFILWLRAYQPGKTVLDGTYQVPPIMEVK